MSRQRLAPALLIRHVDACLDVHLLLPGLKGEGRRKSCRDGCDGELAGWAAAATAVQEGVYKERGVYRQQNIYACCETLICGALMCLLARWWPLFVCMRSM
jgi:hypothetical protein